MANRAKQLYKSLTALLTKTGVLQGMQAEC